MKRQEMAQFVCSSLRRPHAKNLECPGAGVPTGQTEFLFKAGDLNFHSSSYDWLVVTGSDYARFKGTGTINGSGEYKFMLWAGDGEPDTFRIKIWEEDELGVETVVYDNGMD